MAAGAGWAWLRGDGVVHVTDARGPKGPLTAIVERVPVLSPGQQVTLDISAAERWSPPTPPDNVAQFEARHAACHALLPHRWNDPRATRLTVATASTVIPQITGRGPGLTPAGDDVLAGFVLTLRWLAHPGLERIVDLVTHACTATGEPSASLLRAAAQGQAFAPAMVMAGALVRSDGPALAPALRSLTRLGSTTGRAMLTGMLQAVGDRG